jgi:uncharacterized protein YbaA (DUF1428 family)
MACQGTPYVYVVDTSFWVQNKPTSLFLENTMYVDGFVTPVKKDKMADYKKMARACGKIWKEYGALQYMEAVADDVPNGKRTSFPRSVKLQDDEVVVFSYVLYINRKERDRIMAAVMSDKRLAKFMDPKTFPFDGKRMFWGGFKEIVSM